MDSKIQITLLDSGGNVKAQAWKLTGNIKEMKKCSHQLALVWKSLTKKVESATIRRLISMKQYDCHLTVE